MTNFGGAMAVGAGRGYTLALKTNGTIWIWGRNERGQLGNGTTNDPTVPVQLNGPSAVMAIAAGSGVHSIALKPDGTVWTWGGNDYGQLGDGTTNEVHQPVQVPNFNAGSGVLIQSAQLLQLTNAVLAFRSCPGCLHYLQQRTNSAVGNWQTMQTNITGTGAMLCLTNAVPPGASNQFYRIGAVVP